MVGGNHRRGSDSESNVYCACLYNVVLIGVYTMKNYKYSRIIDLVLLFCAGVVGGGLVVAVFTLGFRAITAV